jgi:GAF domain-containing protein
MSLQAPATKVSVSPPGRDLEAFLVLISTLSGRLAGATGEAVDREVDAGLRELLSFFEVEQCGILEIQPDRRQARLRHLAHVEGVTPVPAVIDYGAFFPWTHERAVMQEKMFVQTCIDDLPPEAVIDRASSAALGLQAIINVPVGIGGRMTHVLGLVSSRPMSNWPDPILVRLQMIAETFLAALTRRSAEEESRRLRMELRHADRAAQVGALTASLSHELNQPLMGILANSQAALRLLDQGAVDPGDMRAILESIVRDDKRAAADR